MKLYIMTEREYQEQCRRIDREQGLPPGSIDKIQRDALEVLWVNGGISDDMKVRFFGGKKPEIWEYMSIITGLKEHYDREKK